MFSRHNVAREPSITIPIRSVDSNPVARRTVEQKGSDGHWRSISGQKRQAVPKISKKVSDWRFIMKWTGMYLLGYIIFIAGLLAALWKLGILASIGMAWTLIGVVIAIGIGIMFAVSSSGTKENIEIGRK
jgi:hypothetical protein